MFQEETEGCNVYLLQAMFPIDRQGRLRPAPTPEQPFESVAESVDAFLTENPSQCHHRGEGDSWSADGFLP
jgi:hypothetical protein